jgi:nitrate reductase NapE component
VGVARADPASLPSTSRRDDRVLPATRVLAFGLVPILVTAFVILYGFPADTGRLFAWTIRPTLTPMVLASAYLGGAWFFVRVTRERRWARVGAGLLSVTLFATLLGVATVIHWDRFNHGHVAFWLWATLYLVAPFLVLAAWVANTQVAATPRPDELRLRPRARVVVAAGGGLALAQGLLMFAFPSLVIPVWPWLLTPLTCRVVGAVFCLGSAGLVVLRDSRWVRLRLMVEVEVVMLTLILVGAVRARADLYADRPLTWLLLAGFAATLVASLVLWRAMARRERMPGTAAR